MDLRLNGKRALISGSHRGTGEAIAKSLAAEGVLVAIHSNHAGASQLIADEICQSGQQAVAVWGELTDDAGAEQVITQTLEALGSIDILINNYGTAGAGFWEKSSTDDWLDMYQKNVLSATRLIQGFLPTLKANGWGRIVNLGTIGSHQPNDVMPHYYAAKGAMATMGVSLTKALANTGITVNTVSPGLIHTPELEAYYRHRATKKNWGSEWPDILEKLVENDFPNPSGRIASREEVADTVAFLCSPRSDFINGQNLRIDGGAVNYV